MRLIIAIPVLLLLAYLHPYIPGHDVPLCAIKIGTGFDCPGCGVIRAVSALTHGEILKSLRLNPLGALVAGWMVYKWFERLINEAKGYHRKRDSIKASDKA